MKKHFETIKNNLLIYVDSVDKRKTAFTTEIQDIQRSFVKGSDIYNKNIENAKIIFSQAVSSMKKNSISGIRTAFSEIRSVLNAFITKPCSAETVATLTLLKSVESISSAELKVYFETFKDNYIASKILHEVAVKKYGLDLTKLHEIGDKFISADGILASIDEMQNESEFIIENYDNDTSNMFRMADFLSFKTLTCVENVCETFVGQENAPISDEGGEK